MPKFPEISFLDLFNTLKRKKSLFFVTAAIPVVLGLAYLSQTNPVYRIEKTVRAIPLVKTKVEWPEPLRIEVDNDPFRVAFEWLNSDEFLIGFIHEYNTKNPDSQISISNFRKNLQLKVLSPSQALMVAHGTDLLKMQSILDAVVEYAQVAFINHARANYQKTIDQLENKLKNYRVMYSGLLKDYFKRIDEMRALAKEHHLPENTDYVSPLFALQSSFNLDIIQREIASLKVNQAQLPEKTFDFEISEPAVRQVQPHEWFVVLASLVFGLVLGTYAVLVTGPKNALASPEAQLEAVH